MNLVQYTALLIKSIRLFSWPVGSIYTSTKPTDPHELFGGTWEPIQDTFLWCAGPKHAAGTTGGAETHTQTVEEMPAHKHSSPNAAPGLFLGWGNKSGDGWVTASFQGTGGNWMTENTGGGQSLLDYAPMAECVCMGAHCLERVCANG